MRKLIRLPYRRRLQGKTNYKKRLKLLKSRKLRLVIRRTNKYIIMQIAQFTDKGDKILYYVNSRELAKYGWNLSFKNTPAAYLTGLLLGKKINKKVKEAILDIGVQEKGERLFAALKGVVDSGLNIPHSNERFPDGERISGKHIEQYFNKINDKSGNQFLKYKKQKINVQQAFEKTKEQIEKSIKN